ncbi:MAG: ABC transporter ATP-binding protein [Persicimonas sp.]
MSSSEATSIEKKAIELADDPVLANMLEEERIESEQLDWTLLVRLMRYIAPYRALALGSIGAAIIESLLMTLPAYIIGLALDRIIGGSRDAIFIDRWLDAGARAIGATGMDAMIIYFGAVVATAWGLRWVVGVGSSYLVQVLGQRVVHDLRVDVYRHVTGMDLGYFHDNPVGRLVNRTTFDVQSLSELFSDAFAQGLRDSTFILVLTAVILGLDPVLGAILVGSFPVLIIIGAVYRHYARPFMRTRQAVLSRMNSWLAENLAGMRENQLYRCEENRRAEHYALTEAHQAAVTSEIRAWAALRPAMMITTAVATAVVLFVGYGRAIEGLVTVGVLLTFLQYTARLWVPIRNLTQKINVIQTALTAGERIFDVLDTAPKMADAADADPTLEVEQGAVEFRDVRFQYAASDDEVLRGISFEARPGDLIALVGDTGAGKTTIVSLISRFYDVAEGSVVVDGADVRDYTLEKLRAGVGIIPQDVVVFAGTLRDNVTLGAEVDDDYVMRCLRGVSAESLVDRFDDGLDHVLEESGRTLSAGERQLLSFARGLVANPPILILDEATASVDTETEMTIQTALEKLTAGRTSIVIAHRLSTIRDADQILVLEHGEIVERGTHDELLEQGEAYADLHERHVG